MCHRTRKVRKFFFFFFHAETKITIRFFAKIEKSISETLFSKNIDKIKTLIVFVISNTHRDRAIVLFLLSAILQN